MSEKTRKLDENVENFGRLLRCVHELDQAAWTSDHKTIAARLYVLHDRSLLRSYTALVAESDNVLSKSRRQNTRHHSVYADKIHDLILQIDTSLLSEPLSPLNLIHKSFGFAAAGCELRSEGLIP